MMKTTRFIQEQRMLGTIVMINVELNDYDQDVMAT